jgi:alpha-D-xyloside xylohydrolase
MGLLCSHSRLHGSSSYRVPWTIDNDDQSEEGCSKTLAKWTALKNRLMPYIYAESLESIQYGLPLSLRSVAIEFPEDPTSWYLDRQFMLGSRLMAAPIFEESGEVEFYLPKGKWTSYFTNEVKAGPGWFKEKHGFGTLPLYVRENTVLPLKNGSETRSQDYTSNLEICLYQTQPGALGKTVDSQDNIVELVVGADGSFQDSYDLSGSITVSKTGRDLEGDHSALIEQL